MPCQLRVRSYNTTVFPIHIRRTSISHVTVFGSRCKLAGGTRMPITDVVKKQLAQRVRLHYKVCRDCGARNPEASDRCRKCHGHNLRQKKRELGAK